MTRIDQEIEKFLTTKKQLLSNGFAVEDLDVYGFALKNNPATSRLDLLFTALIHGNEVIGVEVLNQVLEQIAGLQKTSLNIGFLLANTEAARKDLRLVEHDLNRCFGSTRTDTLEHKRAQEISKIVNNADFLFDIHQTFEPALTPFFIFEHREHLIQKAYALVPEIPIVTFATGAFSGDGKTIIEYAASVNCQALTIECGEKGFSKPMADKITKVCFKLIENLKKSTPDQKDIKVTHLKDRVINLGQTELIPGLASYMPIQKGDILAYKNGQPVRAPFDGRLFFPRYGLLAKQSNELASLGIDINIGDQNKEY